MLVDARRSRPIWATQCSRRWRPGRRFRNPAPPPRAPSGLQKSRASSCPRRTPPDARYRHDGAFSSPDVVPHRVAARVEQQPGERRRMDGFIDVSSSARTHGLPHGPPVRRSPRFARSPRRGDHGPSCLGGEDPPRASEPILRLPGTGRVGWAVQKSSAMLSGSNAVPSTAWVTHAHRELPRDGGQSRQRRAVVREWKSRGYRPCDRADDREPSSPDGGCFRPRLPGGQRSTRG